MNIKRFFSILCLISILTFGAFGVMDVINVDVAQAEGIKEKLSSNAEDLDKEVDEASGSFIKEARGIAITIAVVLAFWMGWTLKFGSAEKLADMKKRAITFVVSLFLAFKTEAALGFLFGIFNIDISNYL